MRSLLPRSFWDAASIAGAHSPAHGAVRRRTGSDLADVHVLDVSGEVWGWRRVDTKDMPKHCIGRGHTATCMGWKLLVYGGRMQGHAHHQSNAVMVLDTRTWTWSVPLLAREGRVESELTTVVARPVLHQMKLTQRPGWESASTASLAKDCAVPRARLSHSATLVCGDRVLVFGGWSGGVSQPGVGYGGVVPDDQAACMLHLGVEVRRTQRPAPSLSVNCTLHLGVEYRRPCSTAMCWNTEVVPGSLRPATAPDHSPCQCASPSLSSACVDAQGGAWQAEHGRMAQPLGPVDHRLRRFVQTLKNMPDSELRLVAIHNLDGNLYVCAVSTPRTIVP